MAFARRTPSSSVAPSEAETRAAALTERKETLERRREAIRSEADALRKAIDSTAERGEDASADAAALVDADRRLAAISLEITAAGRALDAARAVVAAEEAAAERARLERAHAKAEVAFEDAERRFREALAALSTSIGPMFKAEKERDRAAAAVGRPVPAFRPDRLDEELGGALRAAGKDVEVFMLEVPYTT